MKNNIVAIVGTGPLGLWTAAALIAENAEIGIRFGNRSGKAPSWIPAPLEGAIKEGRINWQVIDGLSASSVEKFVAGAQAMVQTAAPDYHEWADKLPPMQQNAIRASLETGARLVCADNLYAYAPPFSGPLTEDSPIAPPSTKGHVRKNLVDMLKAAETKHGLVWSTVQSSQYFGPGASGQSVFGDWFINPVLKGKMAKFIGNPTLRHSWAYPVDFGRAQALLSVTPDRALLNRSWIIPHISDLPAKEIALMLLAELDRQKLLPLNAPRKTGVIPRFILQFLGLFNPVIKARDEMLYQFLMDFEASGAKFSAATGLTATPLEQAIRETVSFWKATKIE